VRTFLNEGQGSASYTQDVILPDKISWVTHDALHDLAASHSHFAKKNYMLVLYCRTKNNQFLWSVTRRRIQTWHRIAAATTTYLLPTTMP
jgi:hypothetical protein